MTLLLALSILFQYPHVCDTWNDPNRRVYDPCAGVGFTVFICGQPRGNAIPYHVFVDNIPNDNTSDIDRQKLVELQQALPSVNGLIAYVGSFPISVPAGPHTVRVQYSDQQVTYPVKGMTAITDWNGTVTQCPATTRK
jgi:hypothetical protein